MADALDISAQLDAKLADLSRSVDKANRRLDLTRDALRELIDNEFAYLHVLAAIDAAVKEECG